jgi:hypothetical protein
VINLHSLSEEARLEDLSYLHRKLQEYQRHVKSPANIATFMRFGLWSYSFLHYAYDPLQARNAAKDFREKFYNVTLLSLSSRSTKARRATSRNAVKDLVEPFPTPSTTRE